jgi:hypothetical protein
MSSILAEFPDLRWAASRARTVTVQDRGYPLGVHPRACMRRSGLRVTGRGCGMLLGVLFAVVRGCLWTGLFE